MTTDERLDRIERKLELILNKVQPTGIIGRKEICGRLHIGASAFLQRRDGLIRFGMFREGKKWLMKETDFTKYLTAKS